MKNQWISVKVNYPPTPYAVLSYSTSGMIQRDQYYKKRWESERNGYEITHWMPLPNPPKK